MAASTVSTAVACCANSSTCLNARIHPSTTSFTLPIKNPQKPLQITQSKNPISEIIATGKSSPDSDSIISFDGDDKPREECGVVGIYGDAEASRLCYLALHALQHRGQEGAGIVSVHDNVLHSVTGVGLVSEVFSESKLDKLPGDMAIGHVRYSTAGASMLKILKILIKIVNFGQNLIKRVDCVKIDGFVNLGPILVRVHL